MADRPGPHTGAGDEPVDIDFDGVISAVFVSLKNAPPAQTVELGRYLVELLDRRKTADAMRVAELNTVTTNLVRTVRALNDASSSAELMRRACERVAALSSATRVLLSRMENGRAIPVTAFCTEPSMRPSLPPAFDVTNGSPEARALATNSVVNTDAVPEYLQNMLGDSGFATVPVLTEGRAVALVHIDTRLNDTYSHALEVVAAILGGCFERVGLEWRREQQNALLHDSARRWTGDTIDSGGTPHPFLPNDAVVPSTLDPLTDREDEVFRLLLTGASNATIAAELVITIDTVKSHVKRILRKLGATNRAELIAKYQSPGR